MKYVLITKQIMQHHYKYRITLVLTSRETNGAKIPPTLAATDAKPIPLLRASVGNSSLVYTYNRAKAMDTANLPIRERSMMVPTMDVSVTVKKIMFYNNKYKAT